MQCGDACFYLRPPLQLGSSMKQAPDRVLHTPRRPFELITTVCYFKTRLTADKATGAAEKRGEKSPLKV
jgi:hypothetical protein